MTDPANLIIGTGSIFDSGCEALVNPVNLIGVAGAGLALEFSRRFPDEQWAYSGACYYSDFGTAPEKVSMAIGIGLPQMIFRGADADPKWLINFPTKRHYRDKSQEIDIWRGLRVLADRVESRGIASIAVPALGCGLGGLRWDRVRRMIVERLAQAVTAKVVLYGPQG